MLGIHDRIVFEKGACSFQTSRGQKITLNDRISWYKPNAWMNHLVPDLFATHLMSELACTIGVQQGSNRFVFTFHTPPNFARRTQLASFEILKERVDKLYQFALLSSPPPDLSLLVNREGTEAITWILETIFVQKYTHEASAIRLAWSPPAKQERYEPLSRSVNLAGSPLQRNPKTHRSN